MKRNIAFIGCFFLIILTGLVSYIVSPQKDFSEDENRYLTKIPTIDRKHFFHGDVTEQLDKYASDQFFLRSEAIMVKTFAEKAVGKKDSNGVYFGKNGRLALKKFQSEFDEERFYKNLRAIDSFSQAHKELPITLMLVPTAAYVQREEFYGANLDYDQGKMLEETKEFLKHHSNLHVIDMIDHLKKHKDEEIYYKTDHHWTTLGAYYGYEVLAIENGLDTIEYKEEKVSDSFYGTLYSKVLDFKVTPDCITRYIPQKEYAIDIYSQNGKVKTTSLYENDKLNVKDKYQYFLGGNEAELTIESENKNGKHLLIVKDSYANCFVPFLVGQYESIHLIDLRYYNGSLSNYIKEKEIDEVFIMYNTNNFDEDMSVFKIGMP